MLDSPTERNRDAPAARKADAHCRYIPIRKRDILQAVLERDAADTAERRDLAALGRRLALIFHVEFYVQREALKDAYVRFNPEQRTENRIPQARAEKAAFLKSLGKALDAANFRRLRPDEIEPEPNAAGRVEAKVEVPREVFDELEFHGRGHHTREITVRTWFGLRKRRVKTAIWDQVVFVAKVRHTLSEKARRRCRVRPGAIYVKLFRDIPRGDLMTLFPNARVVMRLRDRLILGVPAVVGGIPVLINLLPALSVLFVVAGAYLGIAGTVEEDALKKALAALSGLGALIGFGMRQWVKYERQKLKYQMQVADNAFFNNISMNGSFFDYLIGASEDAEVKEAFLAYAELRRAGAPLTGPEIDTRIENWLCEHLDVEVDFEVDDALAKLERLGLAERDAEGRHTAVALDVALARCDEEWIRLADRKFRNIDDTGAEARPPPAVIPST